MIPAAEIAGRNPAYFAFETANPIFRRGSRGNSVILSVNAGYE